MQQHIWERRYQLDGKLDYTQKIGAHKFVKNSSKSCQNDRISTSFDGHIDEER